MKDAEFAIKKNILDLQHSESLARGTTEIGLALGGFISIVLSIYNKNLLVAIVISSIFALIFLADGIHKLMLCKMKRKEIIGLGYKYLSSD